MRGIWCGYYLHGSQACRTLLAGRSEYAESLWSIVIVVLFLF